MKILIAYATKHGCAENCSKELASLLKGEVDLCNLKNDFNASNDLSSYDAVIIGGSIYAGQIQKKVREFCKEQMDQLTNKRLGLFICCMFEGDQAATQLNNSFPKQLLDTAISKQCFGGEFNLEKMNFFEKLIVKMVNKLEKDKNKSDFKDSTSKVIKNNIYTMADTMNGTK